MTQDKIIEMARTVSNTPLNSTSTPDLFGVNQIVNFAKLVAEREREACANVCEAHSFRVRGFLDDDLLECKLADAIRARSQND